MKDRITSKYSVLSAPLLKCLPRQWSESNSFDVSLFKFIFVTMTKQTDFIYFMKNHENMKSSHATLSKQCAL